MNDLPPISDPKMPAHCNRREFMQRVSAGAGALLFTPLMQPLQAATVAGSARNPKRVVFVTISNGVNPSFLCPEGVGRDVRRNGGLIDLPLAGTKLPFTLEPLEGIKNRVTILQGLSGRIAGGGHFTNYGALGAYSGRAGVFGETIDLALAKTRDTIFPHLGLGVLTSSTPVAYGRSASGREQPVPFICDPRLAHDQLFGSVAQGEARQALDARDNLIDFLSRDIRKLEAKLTGEERKRMDLHVQGYQAMIDRRGRLDAAKDTLRKHAPVVTPSYSDDCPMQQLAAQFDVATAALISGLTEVVTISSGVGGLWNMTYRSLGINLASHPIGHGGGENGKSSAELQQIIRRYHIELIAGMARKLGAVAEGKGTMLDNTVIVFLSDAAEGHHSQCKEWPMVIVGNLGGALKTNGRYLEYPHYGNAGNRTVANWYLTLLAAAGAPRARFGVADPSMDPKDQIGPLGELLS